MPISTSQWRGLQTGRRATLIIILLVRIGSPAAAWPSPCSLPAHTGNDERGATQSEETDHLLEPGKLIERELSGGQSHFYKITMASDQYLRIAVSQRGIDVLVALFAPDGNKIGEVDSEKATVRAETISAVAEANGAHRIEVRSADKIAKTGRYEIKVEELRAATAEDKYRISGESVFREAERLQYGTLEAKRKSIEKYHEALELLRKAGYRGGEAQTVNNIGEVYWYLGETQKALEKFNESLPIFRAAGDRRGEGVSHNNIGVIYQLFGELHKAQEKLNEALPIFREVGDRVEEAITLGNIGKSYWTLGETQKALETYSAALAISR